MTILNLTMGASNDGFIPSISADPKCCCCLPIKIAAILVGILEFMIIFLGLLLVVGFYAQGGPGHVITEDYRSTSSILDGRIYTIIRADKSIDLGGSKTSLISCIVAFLIGTGSIIGLLIGVIKERPKLVLLHFLIQISALVALAIAIVVYAVIASNGIQISRQDSTPDHFRVIENGMELQHVGTPEPQAMEQLRSNILRMRRSIAIDFCAVFAIVVGLELCFMHVVFKCFRYLANKEMA